MKSVARLALAALALAGCTALVDRQADRREIAAERRAPPEGRFLTLDGRRVHYVQAGAGPDLVLIHGASGNTREFTFSFLDRVRDRYRVTIFDRPGLGYSDVAPGVAGRFDTRSETLRSQAALLATAAERLGVRDPVVLGHSYGGALALAWALDHDPAALVVVSGATEPWEGGLGLQYSIAASPVGSAFAVPLVTAFLPGSVVRAALRTVFDPQQPPAGYLDHVEPGLILRRASFRENAQQVAALKAQLRQMSARYPTLRLPVEIVHGTADTIVPLSVHSERLARQIEGARLTRLDGIGHMPHHAAPEAVMTAIDRAAARAGLR